MTVYLITESPSFWKKDILFHKANFLRNLSSIVSYTLVDLWGAPTGKPKYVEGRLPTL